ncbi:MAG: hypothetical protein V2J89_01825 [Halieaceae bacterium]|jgi:hypothetical protein|nr:hypothetical protein [Halieaceae bacterium]
MLGLSRKHRGKRTVFLGLLASCVLVWAAIDRFDIPPADMARLFGYTVLGVLLTMVLAALCVAVTIGLKALYRKIRTGSADRVAVSAPDRLPE